MSERSEYPDYPVNLRLAGKRCLVVGGGRVATQKARGLAECGATVHVVAPAVDRALTATAGVTVDERAYREGDLAGFHLVVAATGDHEVNQAVFDHAEAAGIWVNSADDPERCSFTLPARLRRGPLLVTVSTGGASPAFATWLRDRLAALVGPEHEVALDLLAEARADVVASGRSTEGLDWHGALDSGMLDLIREGRLAEAKERLQACLSSSSG